MVKYWIAPEILYSYGLTWYLRRFLNSSKLRLNKELEGPLTPTWLKIYEYK